MYLCFPLNQIGGTYAKPVILPPEVAIGALGKIQVCENVYYFNIISCVVNAGYDEWRRGTDLS